MDSSVGELPSIDIPAPDEADDASAGQAVLQRTDSDPALAQQTMEPLPSLATATDLDGEWRAPGVMSVDWNDVPDADGYEIAVLANGEWLLLDPRSDAAGVAVEFDGSSALVAGLPANASSHWLAVRARNAQGLAPWSHSVEVDVPESISTGASELPSFDPFTTPTRSGIDLERLREAAATIAPSEADCDSVPAVDIAGITVVDPPADLGDSDASPTVIEVVRIAGGCLVVEYVELAGRTAAQLRELLAGDDSVLAVGAPLGDARTAHDDGAHAPHSGGHHNDSGVADGEQWHLPQPMMDRLWAGWKSDNTVTVAVLDTGVDERHPDLDDQIVTGGLDACHRVGAGSHGTKMADVIAAEHDSEASTNTHVAGVAPGAKILPIHVFHDDDKTTSGCAAPMSLTAAVATAVNSGAHVINMSLTTDFGQADSGQSVSGVEIGADVTDDTFELALRAAAMLGVVSVAAAGNCGDDSIVGYDTEGMPIRDYETGRKKCSERDQDRAPAAFSLQGNVIAVAAIDESGERAVFSTASAVVDVAAPGAHTDDKKGILTTAKCVSGTSCGTDYAAGTSPAAAYVSGVVAHMLNRHPGATVGQVRSALGHSAIEPPVTDLHSFPFRTPRGRDGDFRIVPQPTREFGRGIVDPAGAVTQLGRLLLGGVTPKGPHGGFVQVSAGSEHTCGLRASGQVLCWGDNDVVTETPVFAFTSLSSPPTAGYVCGVRIDGAVQCWGDVPSVLAIAVAGSDMADAPDGRFTEVAVGDAHVCGLRPTGGVVCWGNSSNNRTAVPFDRFGSEADDRAAAIVAGAAHTCAITDSSDLVCWGDASKGQLGPSTLPRAVREVAAGVAHTCVVNVNSNVRCWGENTHGQLNAPSGEFEGIAAGAHHTCARDADTDSVVCWGRNSLGQNGAPSGRFNHVSAGEDHTCALDQFANVTCWGNDAHGKSNPAGLASLTLTDTDSGLELLGGAFSSETLEYTVQAVADAVRANWTLKDGTRLGLEVTALDTHGNAIGDGGRVSLTPGSVLTIRVSSLFGFGPERVYTVTAEDPPSLLSLSLRAETGGTDCPGAGCPPYELVPVFGPDVLKYRVAVPGDVSLVTVGHAAVGGTATVKPVDADSIVGGHQVALTSSSGFSSVDAGNSHSCGLQSGGSVRCWGSSYPMVMSAPSGVFSQVSVGWGHACALASGGRVNCWGDNFFRQSRPPSSSFSSVSAGWGHSCGLTTGGSARCWGYNFSGQSRPPSGSYISVEAGGNHSCGILSGGTLSCWGLNNKRQASPPGGTFTSLSAGWRHNCAVKDDATVVCWGDSGSGKASAPAGSFVAVSVGEEHSCGLKNDGTLACWGANGSGQANPPAGTYVAVSAGEDHSCALNAVGKVACWGAGSAAQPAQDAKVTITVSGNVEPISSKVYTVAIGRGPSGGASGAAGRSGPARRTRDDILGAASLAGNGGTLHGGRSETSGTAGCNPTMVQIADAGLRSAVEAALSKTAGDPISTSELASLTSLRLPRLKNSSDVPAVADLSGLQGATGLEVLDLAGHSISDVSALSCLTALETLVLSANNVSDLAPLSGLGSLRVLWLDRNDITNVASLGGLTGLKRMYLYDNTITDISALGSLVSLTDLHLGGNDIADVASLASLAGLEVLGLGGNDITSVASLGGLTGLGELYLHDNDIADIDPLGPVFDAGVRIVWLSGNRLLSAGRAMTLSRYRYLDIRYNELVDVEGPFPVPGVVHSLPQRDTPARIADDVLAAAIRDELGLAAGAPIVVGRLAKLPELSYTRTRSRESVTSLDGLQGALSLRRLHLSFNDISDITSIAGLTELRDLALVGVGITDISPLAQLTRLESLQISGNRLHSIDALAGLTGLKYLRITSIGIPDLTPLAGLTSLTGLFAADNDTTSIEPLRDLTGLKHIQLSRNRLTSIEPLNALDQLEWLHLDDNQISDLTPLRGKTGLWLLNINNNHINDISALSGLTALRTLSLADNQVTDFTPIDTISGLTVTGKNEQRTGNGD